ncbi:hypothetical protein GCM10017784_28390 [Deinococcus indicus]|nr:hypothetical protein GCM10017784_28390 [Deinococcus indicus]
MLGKRNAVCTLRQAYTGLMYASVQPGQLLDALLPNYPDGGALGGLVPYAHSRARLTHEVRQVCDQISSRRPLYDFGVGNPDTIHAGIQVGATGIDRCSSQPGKGVGGRPPSLPEGLGWSPVTSSVPWTPHDPSTRAGRYATADVVIVTPERLNLLPRLCLRRRWRRCVELMIVDELPLLSNPERGATLEGIVSRPGTPACARHAANGRIEPAAPVE